MNPETSIADVKARLAALGASLEPDAVLNSYVRPRPGEPVNICVVEAIEDVAQPVYCIHGFASCVYCDRMCYLGAATEPVITDRTRNIFPMCIRCAQELVPKDSSARRVANHADRPCVDPDHQ